MNSNPPSFFFRTKRIVIGRRRAGVSPIIGTIIIMAITVVMGLALYSYANSQTKTATQSFADEATDYINLKKDRFTITGLAFSPAPDNDPQSFTAYIFNSGDRTLQISSATLNEAGSSTLEPFCTADGAIQSKELRGINFTSCPGSAFAGFDSVTAHVYHVNISSDNGAAQTYFQKYGGS